MWKILASTFIASLPCPSARSRPRGAVGVERRRGHRVRSTELTAVHLGERLGGRVRRTGVRVRRAAQSHELVELVARQRADLEVHEGVVRAAQLRTPADERTRLVDL